MSAAMNSFELDEVVRRAGWVDEPVDYVLPDFDAIINEAQALGRRAVLPWVYIALFLGFGLGIAIGCLVARVSGAL